MNLPTVRVLFQCLLTPDSSLQKFRIRSAATAVSIIIYVWTNRPSRIEVYRFYTVKIVSFLHFFSIPWKEKSGREKTGRKERRITGRQNPRRGISVAEIVREKSSVHAAYHSLLSSFSRPEAARVLIPTINPRYQLCET